MTRVPSREFLEFLTGLADAEGEASVAELRDSQEQSLAMAMLCFRESRFLEAELLLSRLVEEGGYVATMSAYMLQRIRQR